MNESKKYLGIKIGLVVTTLFLGVAFFAWTAYPNLQVRAMHRAYTKMLKNADSSEVIDRPFLFSPFTSVQPRIRYLLVTVVVKAYQEKIITGQSKILPFSIQKLEEALPRSTPYFNAYLYLGKAYDVTALMNRNEPKIMQANFTKAAAYYEKALEIIPNQQTAVVSYAINLFDQRKYDSAVKLLRDSLAFDSEISELHYYLGQFLFNIDKKNAPEALSEIERALDDEYNPDSLLTNKTYQGLLLYFYEHKDMERLVTVLNRVKTTNPEQAQVYNQIIDYIEKNHTIPNVELQ